MTRVAKWPDAYAFESLGRWAESALKRVGKTPATPTRPACRLVAVFRNRRPRCVLNGAGRRSARGARNLEWSIAWGKSSETKASSPVLRKGRSRRIELRSLDEAFPEFPRDSCGNGLARPLR